MALRRRRDTTRQDGGQVLIQFVGIIPVLIVVILLCMQAYVTVTAYERVHNAARTAARLDVKKDLSAGGAQQVAEDTLPAWLVENPELPRCEGNETPEDDDCLPDRICSDGEDPEHNRCLPKNRCVLDGEEKPWEHTCISRPKPGKITVKTEIPLLFKGAPLVFPIEQTVTMPSANMEFAANSFAGGGAIAPVVLDAQGKANKKKAEPLAADYGWGPDNDKQWKCLAKLWGHESHWKDLKNQTSSAHGIPQALLSKHPELRGTDYMTSIRAQIEWGLGYIKRRYGTPCGAWAFWKIPKGPDGDHWY